jgi:uncharacterized delta-60 repeat protein
MERTVRIAAILGIVGVALAAGTSGTLDTTFDGDGIATGPIGDALSVAAQSDGKLVVVGHEHGTESTFKVARYDTDGSLDPGFGSGGVVTPFPSAVGSEGQHVTIDGDGRILVAGAATIERTTGRGKKQTVTRVKMLAVARLLSNGDPDTTFGDGGETLVEVPESAGARARALALRSDGKIVVFGMAQVESDKPKGKAGRGIPTYNQALVLLRLDSDGALDTTFGTGGIVVDNVTKDDEVAGINGLALQSDNAIVTATMVRDVTSGDGYLDDAAILRRYDADGSLDTTFGAGGTTAIAGEIDMPSIAVDDLDRIVLGAGDIGGTGWIRRYDADGVLDTSFATAGEYATGLAASNRIRAVVVLDDDRIVAGGEAEGDGFTLRLDADGALDANYGISDLAPADFVFDLAVDANGDYALAGGDAGDFLVARYCR